MVSTSAELWSLRNGLNNQTASGLTLTDANDRETSLVVVNKKMETATSIIPFSLGLAGLPFTDNILR